MSIEWQCLSHMCVCALILIVFSFLHFSIQMRTFKTVFYFILLHIFSWVSFLEPTPKKNPTLNNECYLFIFLYFTISTKYVKTSPYHLYTQKVYVTHTLSQLISVKDISFNTIYLFIISVIFRKNGYKKIYL